MRHPKADKSAVTNRIQRDFRTVSVRVTKPAGGDHVLGLIFSAVLLSEQMLRRRLEKRRLPFREAEAISKPARIVQPHGVIAVAAPPVLAVKSLEAKTNETSFGRHGHRIRKKDPGCALWAERAPAG